MYQQILDTNGILQKSDVESSRQDQTQLDSASERKKNEATTSDAERRWLPMSDPVLTSEFRVFYFIFIYLLIYLIIMHSRF